VRRSGSHGRCESTTCSSHDGSSGFPPHHHHDQFLGVPVIVEDGTVSGTSISPTALGQTLQSRGRGSRRGFRARGGLVIDQAKLRSHVRDLTIAEEREDSRAPARHRHPTALRRGSLVANSPSRLTRGPSARAHQHLARRTQRDHPRIRTTIFEIDQERSEVDSLEQRIETLTVEVALASASRCTSDLAGIDDWWRPTAPSTSCRPCARSLEHRAPLPGQRVDVD